MHIVSADAFGRMVHNYSDMDRAALAKRIRLRTIELGITTQDGLAQRAGLALGTVRRVLAGTERSSHATYEALAAALGWTIDEFLADAPRTSPNQDVLALNPEERAVLDRYRRAMTEVRLRVRQLLWSGDTDELDTLIDAAYATAKVRKRKRKQSRSA